VRALKLRAHIKRKLCLIAVAAVAFALLLCTYQAGAGAVEASPPLSAALCQIVYPLDQFPGAKEYHYTFFGNGFFINEEGYLITASHVVSSFRDGGRPHILVGPPNEPRQLLEAPLIAADWEHDVAILRAEPNPFAGDNKPAYLRLSLDTPPRGEAVLDASLLSSDVDNASSLDVPLQNLSRGEVLDYQFHHEAGVPDSEVLLVSQQVSPGQSGSPLVSADSQGVVGIVVGRWLLPLVVPSSAENRNHLFLSPGAALRVHYAISLLEKNHIAWHAAPQPEWRKEAPAQEDGLTPPVPVSVVGTNYPPQALFGGDVLLDALIDSNGKPTDIRVVSGEDGPFLEPALSAVRTWTFTPARFDGRDVEARIGIVFQFPQSFLPPQGSKERKHSEPMPESGERGAFPVYTVEPDYPVNSVAQGSVVLYNLLDSEGHITSTTTLLGVEPLTTPTATALRKWQFAPAKHAGLATDSVVITVETFRRPTL
jgi:trypsin-like peptidase/TonB-like protein